MSSIYAFLLLVVLDTLTHQSPLGSASYHKTMKQNSLGKGTISRDRLSELPDEVLVHILSFLPTLDAVRTVLLRRFGSLWTLVHSLYFSDRSFVYDDNDFSNFVWNALVFHRTPTINKFHLEMRQGIPQIEIWVRFALGREAQELIVDIYSWDQDSCSLPHCVLFSQSLVSLELIGCEIKHQSPIQMGSLRKLKLDHVYVSNYTFVQVIHGCPSRRCLCVTSSSINRLKIEGNVRATLDCPSLKMLDISTVWNELTIIDVSSLSEAKIGGYGLGYRRLSYWVLKLLENFRNIQIITLSEDTLQLLISSFLRSYPPPPENKKQLDCSSMERLVFPCSRWKHVTLQSSMCETRILVMCKLVRNSPLLEELTIYASQSQTYAAEKKLLDQEISLPCVLPQLKTVTMHGFGRNYKAQLQLAKFLLKSAVNLKKMRFVRDLEKQLAPAEELDFFKQLSSFRQASPNACVDFA